jgi:hypothetical protein
VSGGDERPQPVETAGLAYGVRVEGRLPAAFTPFLRPLPAAAAPPPGPAGDSLEVRRLEVAYRTAATLPEVEEIWAAEPDEPRTRDRFALFRRPDGFGLSVATEGRGLFRIRPRRIEIEWLPGGAGAAHAFFSHALPLWLESRGVTVLHASAVARGDAAVAFVGPSGAGKSTLCAELVAAGWAFVADDGLAVEEDAAGGWRCRLGPPWLRLWPSALEGRLGIAAEGLPRVHETLAKRRLPVAPEAAPVAAAPRLAAVYVLDRRPEGDGPARLAALPPAEALLRLVEHSLAAAPLAVLGLAAARLDRLARAAARVRVARLAFAAGDAAAREVRNLVLADLAGLAS